MRRREFHKRMITLLGAAALPLGTAADRLRTAQDPRVDGTRLNDRLATLGAIGHDARGSHRVAFSDANREARAYVTDLMRAAGLDVRLDAAGNLLGRRAGSEPDLPPLWMGSHIDSVPEGGNYDGPLGVMAAIEAAQTLADRRIETRHPLDVVIFANEEGGKTGSRAMAGVVEPAELELVTASGFTIGEGMARVGGDPDRLDEVRRRPGDVAGYLELHIEQGAVLDADGVDIGVVQGIVGIKRWNVTVRGAANHAGTTPMDRRRDALVAAARFIDAVHTTALTRPGRQVATVGRIEARPGAPNVIPGAVVLSLEIRDLSMDGIDRVYDAVRARAEAIGGDTGTSFSFERFYTSHAAPTDPAFQDVIEAAAGSLGLSHRRMPSGAGHDAQSVARFAPVGMIFVPSRDGISHAPEEWTAPGDVVNGANVLLHSLLALDRR